MQKTNNRGEWSEFYVLLKLLVEKKLSAADQNTNPLDSLIYPILRIIISYGDPQQVEYDFEGDEVVISSNLLKDHKPSRVATGQLNDSLATVLHAITTSTGSTFIMPEADRLLALLECSQIKGSSRKKTDITLKIHDPITQSQPEIGFSIKSQLGRPSTLLNPSGATNFIFDTGLSDFSLVEKINNIESLVGKIQEVYRLGGELNFLRCTSEIFTTNLRVVDTIMPEIVAEMLKVYYVDRKNAVTDIIKQLVTSDPLKRPTLRYDLKIRSLLRDTALGMLPSSLWDGRMEATGGYIIVKSDGSLVCYNIYSSDLFMDYLVANTKLDTPKRERHKFGYLYEEDGKILIKLNLQIRFKQ